MEIQGEIGRGKGRATRRLRALFGALFALGALLGSGTALPGREALAQESACVTDLARPVRPQELALGESVEVSLRVRASCPEAEPTLHIVYVVDASGSMAGGTLSDTIDALWQLTESLDLASYPRARVGLVAFRDTAEAVCELSNQASRIHSCLRRLSASGGSRIDLGIEEGIGILRRGRDLSPGEPINEVLLVLSDGANSGGCDPVKRSARMAKSQGILLITGCVGDSCDSACMRDLASSARYYFAATDSAELRSVFDPLWSTIFDVALRQVMVTDRLPPNMRYVLGSGLPEPSWDPDTRELTWRQNFVPTEGVTFSYRLEPQEIGQHATSLEARIDYRDSLNARGSALFPIEDVTVSAGAPTPTPEPLPELVGSLEVEPAALRLGERAQVRYTLDFELPEPPGETHLALVLDQSGSMAGEPVSRLKEGLGQMLDRLEAVIGDEGSDFAASVVAFQGTASVSCPLTDRFPMLRACVSRLLPAGGTAIDEGLDLGLSTLQEGRPWGAGEDLVIFSDGANNQGCPPVLEAADRIKAEEVVLHAVCLGTACDASCLSQAATSPRHFFQVDRVGDLPIAFGGIAEDLLARRGVESVDLTLRLPEHLEASPESFSIAPSWQEDDELGWSLPRMPAGGLSLEFQVEAVAEGSEPMAMDARVGRLGAEPLIDARRSSEVAVPGAPTEPTPTAPEPGETPSATPTEGIPPPRDTATPSRLYLPLLLREACRGGWTDLVLVLDGSLSMGERFGAEGSKLELARRGLRELVAGLGPTDRAALVSFDAEARLLAPFTGDDALLQAALDRVELARGTAIDAGIDRAVEALLASERRDLAEGVIVLVSDGRALEASPDAAIEAADRARGYKLEVHAIGLGREVDEPTLRAVAGGEDRYRRAEEAEVALRAFDRLGRALRCPSGFTWARR